MMETKNFSETAAPPWFKQTPPFSTMSLPCVAIKYRTILSLATSNLSPTRAGKHITSVILPQEGTFSGAMPRHSSTTRVQCATSSALNLIQSAQIEHQGQYSNHRLRSLQDFINNKFTRRRLAALLLITPWPSIAIVILLELAPLNPPSSGADENIVFWIRFASVMTIMGVCYITMTHIGVPLLNITLLQGILTVAIATAVSVGVVYICSIRIGFPVPFAITIASVPAMMIQWIIMGGLSFRRISANTEAILSLKECSGLVAKPTYGDRPRCGSSLCGLESATKSPWVDAHRRRLPCR